MGNLKNNKRLIHFDLMRIIACFFVIVIHVGIFDQGKNISNQSVEAVFANFYGIISRWAVPCFFMLSGLMFLDKNKEIPLKKLYGKYILRLAVAYLVWSCIYALYNSFYDAGATLYEKFKYFLSYCISGEIHTWYVLVTIGLYMALPVIRIIINKADLKTVKYWIITMFVFASVIPFVIDWGIPFISGYVAYINQYMEAFFFIGYTLYFVLGYYILQCDLSSKQRKMIYILAALGFVYCVVIRIILVSVFNISIGALSYLYPNIIFMSLGVFLFFNDYVSRIKFSEKSQKIITGISGLTFGIYLIHVLMLKVFYRIGINLSICPTPISMLLVSLLVFAACMIIILIIKRIPILKNYIC
ncbi:MAG: acyltransferase family protein [Ruminococcus sp.]|nr:acyltransferase family protein [Ruminococcus sp.]